MPLTVWEHNLFETSFPAYLGTSQIYKKLNSEFLMLLLCVHILTFNSQSKPRSFNLINLLSAV